MKTFVVKPSYSHSLLLHECPVSCSPVLLLSVDLVRGSNIYCMMYALKYMSLKCETVYLYIYTCWYYVIHSRNDH